MMRCAAGEERIAMFDRMIGDVRVTRVEEIQGPFVTPAMWFGAYDVKAFEAQLPWMAPRYFDPASGRMLSSVHTWVLRQGGKTILVDTCNGNHKNRPGWDAFHMLDQPYLQRLAAAGVLPEEVDIVMCTHLHIDHVGWNTKLENGKWVPTFPNARYLMSRTDKEFFEQNSKRPETTPATVNTYNDSVLPIIEAGMDVLVDGTEEIAAGLRLVNAPGHTPGHVGIDLNSKGKRALFSADAFHFPLQVPLWHWRGVFDADPDLACKCRRQFLEHCVEHDALLLPAHFTAPHGGHISAHGDSFAISFDRVHEA